MEIKGVNALILSCEDTEKTATFYRGLGLDIVEEQHGDEPVHFACDFGGVHFAIFPTDEPGKARKHMTGGATKIGFLVDDTDVFYKKALEVGAISMREPCDAPWGRTATVIDPDGRTIELNGWTPS